MLNNLSLPQRLLVPVVLSSPRMRRVALRAVLEDGGRISARQAIQIRRNSANGDWANLLPGFSAYRLDSTPEVTVPFMRTGMPLVVCNAIASQTVSAAAVSNPRSSNSLRA